MSKPCKTKNGTLQRSVESPTLFSVMINDIFKDISDSYGKSLFADNGAVWVRGRIVVYLFKKLQEGIDKVEKWSCKRAKICQRA